MKTMVKNQESLQKFSDVFQAANSTNILPLNGAFFQQKIYLHWHCPRKCSRSCKSKEGLIKLTLVKTKEAKEGEREEKMTIKIRLKEKVIKMGTNEIKYYFSKQLNVISWKTLMKYMFGKTENGKL